MSSVMLCGKVGKVFKKCRIYFRNFMSSFVRRPVSKDTILFKAMEWNTSCVD